MTVQVGGLGGVNSTILESSDAYVSETSPFIPAVIGSALLFFVTYVSYFAAEGYFKGRDVVIKNEIIEKSEADIARQFKEAGVDATILQNAVTAENLANLVAYKIHHVSREKNKLQADMEKLEAVISNLLHAKPIKDKDETSHKTQWFFWTRKSNSNESGDSTATTATNASQTTTGNTGNTSDNAEAATQEDTKILESTMPHTVVHLAYGNYLRVMKEFDDLLKPFCDAKGETAIKSLQSAAAAVLLDLKIEEVKREGSFEAAERARNSARNLTRRLLRLGKFSFCLVTNPGSTARSNGGTANG